MTRSWLRTTLTEAQPLLQTIKNATDCFSHWNELKVRNQSAQLSTAVVYDRNNILVSIHIKFSMAHLKLADCCGYISLLSQEIAFAPSGLAFLSLNATALTRLAPKALRPFTLNLLPDRRCIRGKFPAVSYVYRISIHNRGGYEMVRGRGVGHLTVAYVWWYKECTQCNRNKFMT